MGELRFDRQQVEMIYSRRVYVEVQNDEWTDDELDRIESRIYCPLIHNVQEENDELEQPKII